MFSPLTVVALLLCIHFSVSNSNLKCLVCQRIVAGMVSAVEKEDPRKKIQVGSFRILPDGTQKKEEVSYAGSELHVHEILETICESMNDFAQAKHKQTGELTLLNLSTDVEKLSMYELVPDPDLNRNLKHYCEAFIEEFEEEILGSVNRASVKASLDLEAYLCHSKAGYCKSLSRPGYFGEL